MVRWNQTHRLHHNHHFLLLLPVCQMKNSVKPCLSHSLHWISWFQGAGDSWQIQTVPSEYLLFMCELSSAAESWRGRLNEISVPLEAGTVHALPCFPQVKASFEVRSSGVLQPHCRESLMCLSSPLIIMLIKISLIHLTTQPPFKPPTPAPPTPSPPKHQILFTLTHACWLCYELPVQRSSLGELVVVWIFLKVTVNRESDRLVLQKRLSFSRVNKWSSSRGVLGDKELVWTGRRCLTSFSCSSLGSLREAGWMSFCSSVVLRQKKGNCSI